MTDRRLQFQKYLDGELSEKEFEELSRWMAADPANAAELAKLSLLDTHLREKLHFDSIEPQQEMDPPSPARQESTATPARRIYHFFVRPTPFSMTVASLVMLAIVAVMWFVAPPIYRRIAGERQRPGGAATAFAARVTNMRDCVWEDGQIGAYVGAKLTAGHEVKLQQGVVECTHVDGTKVALRGPCRYVIDSRSAGTLQSGELVASVPPQAVGFTIDTKVATIVDLSTRFGVRVGEDEEVSVFVLKGRVRAAPKSASSQEPIDLSAGQSLVCSGPWTPVDTASADQDRLEHLAETARTRQIRGVRILDRSSELTSRTFDRRAKYLVDGSGFGTSGHSPNPDETMWLTNGTLEMPHDPLPAFVVFDLRSTYELKGIHVWNYNEQLKGFTSRGAREVEIRVSPTDDPADFVKLTTSAEYFEFPEASGAADYQGEPVRLEDVTNRGALDNVRLIEFKIRSRHGPNPLEHDPHLTGLSEVRFFGRAK